MKRNHPDRRKGLSFDNFRLETYESVLAMRDNIDVFAAGEGWSSPGLA